jgi:hypothetical protein
MYWSPLIEDYDGPLKGWLVYIGLLVADHFNVSVIFCFDGPRAE